MFASASPDNIKQWTCPDGKFIQNLSGHNAIINCLAVNPEGVLVSGADNGTLHCWDWRTGYNFQRLQVCYISKFSFVHNLILFGFLRSQYSDRLQT
jgi:WD40 repeat protein